MKANQFIQLIQEKADSQNMLMELIVTDLIQKFHLIKGSFLIPLSLLESCSVIEKQYIDFSILEIRNSLGDVIGTRLSNRQGEICQVTLLENNEKKETEYRIMCNDLHCIITEEEDGDKKSTFEFMQNGLPKSILNTKEYALHRMKQMIEESNKETIKIYSIRRKGF